MTSRTITEIEVSLAKHDKFNYIKNVVAFNVNGLGESLKLLHECDMLVLSKSGYLTEIEIKRSWQDFLNDFKKTHDHYGYGLIKHFYYCVPLSIKDKAIDYFNENGRFMISGFIIYDEELNISFEKVKNNDKEFRSFRKLFLEEQFQVARFGAMRAILLREKLNKIKQ